ncbi:diguanylate cyclase (GGDEF)-like protein [Acidovorax sp. 107]|uniref:bifunctional diguanylate cyclase/phosphodiesterase n=1 Tax=Acidovorax sp. 107 TaxID=2135638 RepID=UPI000D368B0B|nr:EAL domain-containing protein [Acidovorax sp. 107]PUA96964.1 diguanylate cyclase (GGDEF)-like protein [Acidovorax sp. 107]
MTPTPDLHIDASAAPGQGARVSDDVAGSRDQRWLPVVLPPLIALLTLGLTFLYWQSEETNTRTRREQNFEVAADQIAYNLKDRMATYEVVLRGVKGYFEGSERIDRTEFQAYVSALQLQATRPGLQGVSLILQFPGKALAAHLEDMRERGFDQYAVRPPGERELLAPITHIEPLEGPNLKALGLDVLTIPPAKEALDRARDTGALALSGQLTLMQNGVPGLVMYMPLYGASADVSTVEGRRLGLAGWVSAPFRMEEVIHGMSREFDADIGLQITDSTPGAAAEPAAAGALLFRNLEVSALGAGAQVLQARRELELGGRRWTLQMAPRPGFVQRFQEDGHHPVALLGTALSLILAWFTWLLATGRERAVALARDMTAELCATRDDLESTLSAIPDLLFELGLDGCIHHYRSARSGELAVPPEMFLGRLLRDVVPPEAAAGCHAALEAAHHAGYSSGHQFRLELGGVTHWFELSIARKESAAPGDEPRFIALSRDITERKQAEARSHQLAYFDALTGLPNRRMLLDRMEHALANAQKAAQVGAVLYIDLDDFKQINDARGHTVGDTLLMQVAQRLTQLQRPGDTVARLGGDEFVVLVHNVASDMESAGRAALLVAEEMRAALEVPYTIDTHLYSTTGSIGITLFPKRGEGVEDLLREADTAMYRAKDLGRNRIRFYEAAMQADVQERLALEQDLKKAQTLGELAAFVQNQVDAAGNVVGGEFLMRWTHPVRGNVPPSRFIPIAEASGLILRMGDWMIQQACETLARLQAAGRELSLSVNVSERQFRQDDFVDRVRHILAHTGANPAHLILEVTESLLIEDLDDTIARMTEIVQFGVRFSIDDFGTGYSSLAYLKRLPLYELKIDKSFVQDTPDDPNDTAIVQSIISVARHLNLRVVAEGVETRAQADFLVGSQCECLQGYLFGRPEPLAAWVGRLVT